MSAPDSSIESAFSAKLLTLATLPSVAWPNVPFTPTVGVTFLKPHLLQGEPFQREIGTAGINEHGGIYQISIFTPAGNGPLESNTLRDALINHFKRGTVLTYNGVSTTVIKAFSGAKMEETDFLHTPIKIIYRTFATN